MSVFVFGSNEAGRHGRGSALEALQHHGAVYGRGWGRQGNAYAIPTRDRRLRTLPPDVIHRYVQAFLNYARRHPDETFDVVPIGCGLAGYRPLVIAPMFRGAPPNVHLPPVFTELIR